MKRILLAMLIVVLIVTPAFAWQKPFSGWFLGSTSVMDSASISDGDTSPSVSGGNVFVTSSNTGATEITTFDDATVGQIIYVIGGSNSNSSTISDGGEFNLSATFTASVDDVLILYAQAADDFIEIGRVNN